MTSDENPTGKKPDRGAADADTPRSRLPKAVAVTDSESEGALPRVVATGEGRFAEQILQVAWANDIKVREDEDLVEILAAIDVDSEIPLEAFAAVAEILSYVYRANEGLAQSDPQPEKQP